MASRHVFLEVLEVFGVLGGNDNLPTPSSCNRTRFFDGQGHQLGDRLIAADNGERPSPKKLIDQLRQTSFASSIVTVAGTPRLFGSEDHLCGSSPPAPYFGLRFRRDRDQLIFADFNVGLLPVSRDADAIDEHPARTEALALLYNASAADRASGES